jgi:hypothetical protein
MVKTEFKIDIICVRLIILKFVYCVVWWCDSRCRPLAYQENSLSGFLLYSYRGLQTPWDTLLSSKLLFLKLYSNLSFLGEIWASLLSYPLDLHSKHFIDDLRVFVTLGAYLLDRLGVVQESPRLWWTSESLYYPLLCGDLIVETKFNLDDRSERFSVERNLTLCELLNGDVGILCGGWTLEINLVSLCLLILIYLLFLLKFVLS